MDITGWPLIMKETSKHGRGLVASRAISPGERVLEHAAFAVVVRDAYRQVTCARCLSMPRDNIFACGGCRSTFYCTQDCVHVDALVHRKECSWLVALSELELEGESQPLRLALRVAAIACNGGSDSRRHKGADVQNLDSLKLVLGLEDHWDKALPHVRVAMLDVGRALVRILGNDAGMWTAEKLARLLMVFQCNAHSVRTPDGHVLGLGLFPLASMLNHSCEPNSHHIFKLSVGALPSIAFIAVDDISPQEELLYSYVDLLQPAAARQASLKSAYLFDCDCRRCAVGGVLGHDAGKQLEVVDKANTERRRVEASLGGLRCSREQSACGPDAVMIDEGEVSRCSSCGHGNAADAVESLLEAGAVSMRARIEAMQQSVPSRTAVLLQMRELGDALFTPGRLSLHRSHWLVYHALSVATQLLPQLLDSPSAHDKDLAWLWAACELWSIQTLRDCVGYRPFPEVARKMLTVAAALKKAQEYGVTLGEGCGDWWWPCEQELPNPDELLHEGSSMLRLAKGCDSTES